MTRIQLCALKLPMLTVGGVQVDMFFKNILRLKASSLNFEPVKGKLY